MGTNEHGSCNSCTSHENIENRVCELEKKVKIIYEEMANQSVATAQVQSNITMMLSQQTSMSTDIKELRVDMLNLVTTTLQKSQTDMASWIKITEDHRHEKDQKDIEYQTRSEEKDKTFYRKLIIACVSILGTIVLSFFGIKALIPLFIY